MSAFVVSVLSMQVAAVLAAEPARAVEPVAPPGAVNPAPVVQTVTTPGPTILDGQSITTDTLWGPLGSPYIIRRTLTIGEQASLTLLPGTVIKLDGQADHNAGISVKGQFLSLGTPANRVVITSYKDDMVMGDTNGDGSASVPARGDWLGVTLFGSLVQPAATRPVSVLDYTDVRYGGYSSGGSCQGHGAVGTNGSASLVVSNSSITDSLINGVYSDTNPDLGFVGVYNSHFARSQCGVTTSGDSVDVVGNIFDNSFGLFAFFAYSPKKVRFWHNVVGGKVTVAGSPAPTRAQADVRFNNLAGGVGSYGTSSQQMRDYSVNWWSHNVNTLQLPACATQAEASAASPQWTLNTSTVCPDTPGYTYPVTGYVKSVLPAMSGAPGAVPNGVNEASAPRYGPVNTASGALTYEASDLVVQDAGKQVTATRTYRSDAAAGDAGVGWSTAFSEALSTANGTATMTTADGASIGFGIDPAAGYLPAPGVSAGFASDAGGSQVTTPGQDTYQFDPNGALTGMLLGDAGHKLDITRAGGQLERVTGVSGRYIAYTRTDGKLRSLNDSTGRSAGFAYTDGRLTAASGVDGKTETYAYDPNGKLSKVTAPSGRAKLAVGYHTDGKVAWVEQEGSGRSSFSYDTANRRTTVTLPDGGQADQDYDSSGRLVTDQIRGGSGRHVVYDGEGRAMVVVTGVPTVPMTGYGPAADTTVFDGNGDPVMKVDPQGVVVRTTFNAQHKQLVTTYGDATTITRTYDGDGRLATVTDQRGKVWRYGFNTRGQATGRTDPLGRTATYTYTANGDRATVADETGATTTYDNDPQGRPAAVTDPIGRRRTLTYTVWDEPERVTQSGGGVYALTFNDDRMRVTTTDPTGATTRYEYDGAGRLSASVDPAGQRTTVEYDGAGRAVKVTDARGGVTTRTYSPEGWPTSATDPTGAVTRSTYDPAGRTVRITDALGQVVQTVYDRAGRTTKVQTPDGATRSYTYDLLGRQSQSTDPLGRKWLQAYDAAGNPTVTTDPLGKTIIVGYDDLNRPAGRTNQAGAVSTITYHDATRTTTITDALGVVEAATTDAAGQLVTSTDGRGGSTVREYDVDGRVAKETGATGGVTTYAYDGAGRVRSMTDPLGRTITGEYDSLGRLTRRTWPGETTETFEYDAAGNLTKHTDRSGATRTYGYDAVNRATSAKDPLGYETKHAYDALGRLTRTTDPTGVVEATGYDPAGRPAVRSDATGASWVNTYDLAGNVLTHTDPAGVKVANTYDALDRLTRIDTDGYDRKFTYDPMSRVLTYTDQFNQVSTFEYDVRGRRTASIDPLANRTTRGYDLTGNEVSVTAPGGQTSQRAYDLAGRVTSASDPLGNTSRNTYNAAGELTALTLPRGGAYTYTYDAAGRVESEQDPRASVTRFAYDQEGRLTSTTYPSGRVVAHAYDLAGRRTTSTAGTDVRTFGYDTAGRLTSAGGLGFGYDNRGQLVRSTDAAGDTAYTYDAALRLASKTPPSGATTTYAYDTEGRLSQVRGGTSLNYSYNYTGRSITRSAVSPTYGSDTRYLDAAQRPTRVTAGNGAYDVTAQYSTNGQVTSLTQTGSGTTAFGYDAAGRLTSAGTATYGWDADGNRTEASTVQSTYDAANRLTGASDGSAHTYDADGNLTDVTRSGTTTHYSYNGFGELVAANNGATSVTYGRDALGRTTSSGGDQLSYDGPSTRLSQFRAGTTRTDLVRDPSGSLLAETTQGGGSSRVFHNLHGDVGMVFNGTVQQTKTYDAFGNAASTGTAPVPLGFQSMLTDGMTGLVDMGARSYDAATGRFTAVDDVVGDLTSPVTLNRYTYGNADPLNFFDPDGRWSIPGWEQVTSFVAKVADWVGDRITDTFPAAKPLVEAAKTLSREPVRDALIKALPKSVAQVAQHVDAVVTNIQQTVYRVTHDPKAAFTLAASFAAGAATFAGCALLTAGAGTPLCVVAAFTVGGAVAGALDCPDGQAVLSCAGTGALAGAVGGVVAAATGGLGFVAAGALSGAAASAAGQLLTTGAVNIDRVMADGLIGGVLGAVGKAGVKAPQAASRVSAGWSALKERAKAGGWGDDRGSISLGRPGSAPNAPVVGSGRAYSVAFEVQLKKTSYPGITREDHFQEANTMLLEAMDSDPAFATAMDDLIPGLRDQLSGPRAVSRKSPLNWTWHHALEPGLLQLVPRVQHKAAGNLQKLLHPGRSGGFKKWGE
ncbi:RHS repeat-associated core domain-containing protein [Lentzea terrae]|uniref:RHS repeat-associated core domain-containing protein n=1 Tax=Lentzea terrae TaxID=2200761 RepID=UPI0018E4F669|nr:RHS repeat-associated core domain-containing protein [Lentzea terrae]